MGVANLHDVQVGVFDLLVTGLADFEVDDTEIPVPVFDHPPRDKTGVFVIMDGFGVQDRSPKNCEISAHTFMVRVHLRPGGEEAYEMGLDLISAVAARAHAAVMGGEICGASPRHIFTDVDAGDDGVMPSSTSRYRVNF